MICVCDLEVDVLAVGTRLTETSFYSLRSVQQIPVCGAEEERMGSYGLSRVMGPE